MFVLIQLKKKFKKYLRVNCNFSFTPMTSEYKRTTIEEVSKYFDTFDGIVGTDNNIL